jgi:hypothetical protein
MILKALIITAIAVIGAIILMGFVASMVYVGEWIVGKTTNKLIQNIVLLVVLVVLAFFMALITVYGIEKS